MKNVKRSRLISALLSAMVAVTSAGAVPISASAADTDAVVTAFRQMRCNTGKSGNLTSTGESYKSAGYLIDILTGNRLNAATGDAETTDGAEMKTSAREYALMRIELNSEKTEQADIQFAVNGINKTFAAYDYNYADWTELQMTNFNSVPNSPTAADINYAASLAAGFDWSQQSVEFAAAEPLDESASNSDKKVTLSIPITADDVAAGYKDILIKNNTSDDDATKITTGLNADTAVNVTTYIKTYPKSVSVDGSRTASAYALMLPSELGQYTASVTDENGNAVSAAVTYSVDDTDNFEIDSDGTLIVKAGVAAGEYTVNITAAVDPSVCEDGETVVSEPFDVTVTVSGENPIIETEPSKLLWFRANGKSSGVPDGSCGSNWYYAGDGGLKESNEIESGTGFGLVLGIDISGIERDDSDLYDLKMKLVSAGASENLALWPYDGTKPSYYGDAPDQMEVTAAIKTMLPSWNTDWTYDLAGTVDEAALASVSPADGIYTFDLDYDAIKDYADENGIVSFFVTSENLSSRSNSTKVYLSGENAPKISYSYRAKPQIDGITIEGADSIVFSGTAADGDSTYKVKYKTQYDGVTYDIADGMITWSIDGNENVFYDASSRAITVSDELAEGTYTVTLRVRYKKGETRYEAEKEVAIEKKEASIPKSVKISGKSSINLVTALLPAEITYTAEVLNQNGEVMNNEECDWSLSGTNTDGISINNGVLSVSETASSALLTIKAASKTDMSVYAEYTVTVEISEYESVIYPTDDVLFRKGNTDTKNVNGAELEITNSVDNDRAFVGGLKFDISSLKQAVNENRPIVSIKLRLTSTLSKDGKLLLKPLSNDWDESDSTLNSYEAKSDIITEAVSSSASVIDNEENKSFTLNRMAKDKYIYSSERAETETLETWQTELDITDYILGTGDENDLNKNGYIADNSGEDFLSLLIMANYNGTNANKIFTKDASASTYSDHWAELIAKFPELAESADILKPALIIDYAKESVKITSEVSTLPVPLTDKANSARLTAEHYNPFTDETDTDIEWSIVGFTADNGEYSASPSGITISSNGTLSVSKSASSGTVTVRAASKNNTVIHTDFDVAIAALASSLTNGSFESVTDAMMPEGWTSYDPDIDGAYNGVRRYKMDQTSETQLANITRTSDDDGLVSGSYTTDPDGNKALMFKGAAGIDKDYEGYAYAHNAANSSSDGGPDIRITSGITYWVSQDYKMKDFRQLNESAVVGPYMSYEGFQGTTSKKSQFNGTWYFKDGNPTTPYTTDGYDTLVKQITVPTNVNRLRINWGFKAAEGEIYFRNFRIAPQGIDSSKAAADGVNELKVTDKMTWTSDPIAVAAGSEYTYKLSVMTDNISSGLASIVFKNSEGTVLSEQEIKQPKTLEWKMTTGTVTPPENTAYAEIRLENGAKSGSVWYDDIIFTRTADPVPTYITLTSDNTLVTSPVSGEYRYAFTASVTDQYNNPCDAKVNWSVDYAGLSILENGALIVSSDAEAGNAVITAKTDNGVSDTITVKVIKEAAGAEQVSLVNGDFSETEDNMPVGWTNSDKELSIANYSFDTSVSGWNLNYTTYSSADTSALIEWDQSVDHTANSGGAARIYNADRAQGSMQISNNITVTGGQMYDLSVWVKTDNISTDSNAYVNILILDKNGSTIEENKQLLCLYPTETDGKGNNTSDWTKLSGSMYIHENAAKMRIDLRYRGGANNTDGTVWFDDLCVSKQTGLDNEKSYNGENALMLKGYNFESNDSSREYGEKWDSTLIENISEGQEYYYSVNMQTLNASDGAYVMITYYNAAGREILTEKSEKLSDTQEAWTAVKGASTAPEGAVSAVMSLCVDGTGTAWFADAKFETKETSNVTALSIAGSDTVTASSENYYYAVITDQYGLQSDRINIAVTADNLPSGMKYDQAIGKLTVADNISAGTGITLKASYGTLTATKNVKASSLSPTPTPAQNPSSSSGGGGGGGGGGSVWSGSKSQISTTPAPSVMGNFSMAGDNAEGLTQSTGTTIEQLLPQPDVTYFTQGMDNVAGFTDIGSVKWAHKAIAALRNVNIISGKEETRFCPNDSVTRAEFTHMLIGMLRYAERIDAEGAECGFNDVPGDAWYYESVAAAVKCGIVSGISESEFAPDTLISRQDMCVMIDRACAAAEITLPRGASIIFNDETAVSAYALNSVRDMSRAGIIAGFEDGTFRPLENATRAQAAVIIYRMAGGTE